MKILELFCGTKSIGKVAQARGHQVYSLDFDPQFKADLTCDILSLPDDYFCGQGFDAVWASPPCTTFSVASMGHHWGGGRGAYIPKTDAARTGLAILRKTEDIIRATNPGIWFMENPRGMMRKMTTWPIYHRKTVTYCQYGDTRMKPTDIWTNADTWWSPKPVCKNGDSCHTSAPRGSKTGTQGIKGARDRSIIPETLCLEIIKVAEAWTMACANDLEGLM